MTRIAVTEARRNLAGVLNRVARRGQRVLVNRYGQPVAALVSMKDLKLLEDHEDRLDLEEARRAMRERRRVPWVEVKRRLGLGQRGARAEGRR